MEQVFFMHIPKTAGTALRHLLYEQFDQSEIFPNTNDIQRNNGIYPVEESLLNRNIQWKSIRLFTGHYSMYTCEAINNAKAVNFKPITLLRVLIERTISHIYHAQRAFPDFKGKSLDYIFENLHGQLKNGQVRMLIRKGRQDPITDEDYARAVSVINKFKYVGLTEKMDASIQTLNKMFRWSLNYRANKVNVNPNSKAQDPISNALMEKIIMHNKYDTMLYAYVEKKFHLE